MNGKLILAVDDDADVLDALEDEILGARPNVYSKTKPSKLGEFFMYTR